MDKETDLDLLWRLLNGAEDNLKDIRAIIERMAREKEAENAAS